MQNAGVAKHRAGTRRFEATATEPGGEGGSTATAKTERDAGSQRSQGSQGSPVDTARNVGDSAHPDKAFRGKGGRKRKGKKGGKKGAPNGGAQAAGGNSEMPPNWRAVVDPKSGRNYYYNTVTQETAWQLPDTDDGSKKKKKQKQKKKRAVPRVPRKKKKKRKKHQTAKNTKQQKE